MELVTIRKCEDNEGYKIRLFNNLDKKNTCTIKLPVFGYEKQVNFKPFEILTFICSPKAMKKTGLYKYHEKICLNGWWDFYPVYEKDSCKEIPAQGWLEKAYLVPSLWRKPLDCVKTPDEEYFREYRQEDLENIEELQFLYDDFSYPNTWTLTKEAWVRRYFDIECIEKEKQYIILLEAVMPYSALYINGRKYHHLYIPLCLMNRM